MANQKDSNKYDRTDNNDQRQNDVHGGEFRNGHLSQIKNNNPNGDDVQNEYLSQKE
ncbi:hypothetical protein [Paenibacillus silvisoli]|uniref:hypothetical protein n=1 Tax=Paenibacillus silvisoli TaxID=3110539 RepID=UPI002804E8C5|nr:hypothetical protein [Paenibacillus silvisoli]